MNPNIPQTVQRPGQPATADIDPTETQEWLDSLEAVVHFSGPERANFLLERLLRTGLLTGLKPAPSLHTPYRNTIHSGQQPTYPGNLDLEQKLTAAARWNAMMMVLRANRQSSELGGHIATYASAADLYEVAFHHFFQGPEAPGGADLVFYQPHASPGIYARAFLEGRLSEEQLDYYRREVGGQGLSSYPHPWLMPDFWQFPTGSMGLGPVQAVYQARLLRYLENRGLVPVSNRKVWCFVGDGEMDEPESRGALGLAAREGLDNLIFVVNCNLQRLDGPVRGNSNIVQELEGIFTANGWNTIKVLWGSAWDDLFENDRAFALVQRLGQTRDGDFQTLGARDGAFNRETFFASDPEVLRLVQHLSDEDINRLERGGHDPVKIHAAYAAAVAHRGQPTVILAKTKKGYGMGSASESRNAAHQQKKMDTEALKQFRDRFAVPISDDQLTDLPYYRPPADSPEAAYLRQRREQLGGQLPIREVSDEQPEIPGRERLLKAVEGSQQREVSTTMAYVQLLGVLLRDANIGARIVPIVPDEARTFGMQSLFRQVGIYNPEGQQYRPEDADQLLYYREDRQGQILQEGINEDGAFASWIAAATSYSNHRLPLMPFYTFYSMFGFQRIGDLAWAAGDSRARGFLVGGTAGRTTLSGEGLQHEDGHSHVLASTIPNCRAYDPAYAYELAVIIHHGLTRMFREGQDEFYYLTVMNENYVHPAMPEGAEEGIVRGLYLLRPSRLTDDTPRVQLFGSGTILRGVLEAAEQLESNYGVAADVWSVTSYTELRRDGMAVERFNRLHPGSAPKTTYLESALQGHRGPVIAASDYQRTLPDLIRPYLERPMTTLGTDGFGRSDFRAALRNFYEVNRESVVVAALNALFRQGQVSAEVVQRAIEAARMTDSPNPWDS